MSLIQAWFFGIIAFLAMTVSLALAFSIAITGPPSDEELTGIEAALDRASRQAAIVTRDLREDLGATACAELPAEATAGLCPEQAVAAAETEPAPTPIVEPVPELPAAPKAPGEFEGEDGALAQNSIGEPDLLGGEERAAPAPLPRVEAPRPERRTSPPPRVRVTPPAARRAPATRPRSPLSGAQVAGVPPLAQPDSERLVAVRPAAETAIAAERARPSQEQAAPAEGYVDDGWSEGEWYERDQAAEDDDAYADDYDAYEERRERRRERRRARREEQRYYGGW